MAIRILAVMFLFGILASDGRLKASEQQTRPYAVNLDELEWSPPGGGNGVPLGTRTARQGVDPVTDGVTYYAMFPAGTHFDLHWHTHDEYVVVVDGSVVIELGEQTHTLHAGLSGDTGPHESLMGCAGQRRRHHPGAPGRPR